MSTPSRTRPGAAFAYRDFRLYQVARLLTIVGIEAQSVAVGWQVYSITHRALDLGWVGLVQFLPGVLLSVVAGNAADRFDRRGLLRLCFVAYAVCSALLLIIALRQPSRVLPIYGVLVLLGVVRAFSGPTGQSLMPQLVPADVFPNAVAWGASAFQVATIIGPAVGGIVYGLSGAASGVYAMSVCTCVTAIVALSAMHVRTGRMESRAMSWETFLAGFRYVWRHQVILGSISLDLFAVLLGGAVALLPVYAQEILHVGPIGLGWLRAAGGIGAVVTAIVLAYFPLRRHSGAKMFVSVGLFGVCIVVFGVSHSFWLSMVALTVAGAADMISVFVRGTLVQLATPPEMRGRVSAVNMLFIGASNELGQFESGVTAQWFGAVTAVIRGGVGTVVVVGAWSALFPKLRRVDRLIVTPEADTHQAAEVDAGR
jgi:MFS family permease